ncbi:MAG TPA: RES domain-containing protein [Actinomycetota bacterium]|nr:RES domain-containing protein [Actinomycetota bacterium]
MLYRWFPWAPDATSREPGGPLYVPRFDQGGGRHDNPDVYGAFYVSRVPASPVAEILRDYAARALPSQPLFREGAPSRLVAIDESAVGELLDLDDPRSLVARELRPSGVATRNRDRTQRVALRLYEEGVTGFEWWSTIEASWINVTLFEERVAGRLEVVGEPEPLTLDHPAVREAAEAVGVLLG